MRQYDLPSLYRSTIGFDRLFSMLDQVSGESQNYPPYNIERVGENAYRLTVAAAGFSADELSIEVKENALTLRGEKKATARSGTRRSPAAPGLCWKVTSASYASPVNCGLKASL